MSFEISLRPATWDDRKALFDWYQEPLRELVFHCGANIPQEVFFEWYGIVLKDSSNHLFVIILDILRIGAVWARPVSGVAQENALYQIDACVRPQYAGQRYLEIAVEKAKQEVIKKGAVNFLEK